MASKPDIFDGKDLSQWSEAEVVSWLEKSGYSDMVSHFHGHDVDGEVLPHLTEPHLEEMGISNSDQRLRLFKDIRFEVGKHQHKVCAPRLCSLLDPLLASAGPFLPH